MSQVVTGTVGHQANEIRSTATVPTLRRLHHYAFPIADQDVTRHFIEDLIGLPLKATWAEQNEHRPGDPEAAALPEEWSISEPGTYFCHTFYELADGSALAFFQFDGEQKNLVGRTNIYSHVALETDQAGQDGIHQRLLDAGVEHYIINHGYVTSLYVTSPDGILFEVCVDPDYVDEIRSTRGASAHDDLRRWMSGDHTVNNVWREMSSPPVVYPGRTLYQPPAG